MYESTVLYPNFAKAVYVTTDEFEYFDKISYFLTGLLSSLTVPSLHTVLCIGIEIRR